MADPVPLDRDWLRRRPLPQVAHDTDKNARGRVLVIGGSRRSPGALLLTGLAAFRAGAGKVQLATLADLCVPLGLALPEAGIVALPETGDGGCGWSDETEALIEHCDTLVLGPGMGDAESAGDLLERAIALLNAEQTLVIDAAAIRAAGARTALLGRAGPRCVLTPHAGELAALLGHDDADAVERDPQAALGKAVERTGQVVLAKGATTYLAAPGTGIVAFVGGGPGLATGGSGDVLAGIVGALLARGQEPLDAAGWGVWLHGEAGRRLAERTGPVGFLARELVPEIPRLMRAFA